MVKGNPLVDSSNGAIRVGIDLAVEANQVSRSFGKGSERRRVLEDVQFSVPRGDFVCIVGPSGTGKTTLLRCLAGLLPTSSGEIRVNGRTVNGPPEDLALVLQDYSRSLLPWMRVAANVALPLRPKKMGRSERKERAMEGLNAVGLAEFGEHYPWQMSGGMQQRASIARALAYRPDILLMDEPFASVDAQTREDLEDLTLKVRKEFGITVVLVTHDIDEAVYLADSVVVLSGSPSRVSKLYPVQLGDGRDQIETKSLPEYASIRAAIHSDIKMARPAM